MKYQILSLIFVTLLLGCNNEIKFDETLSGETLHFANRQLTEISMEDIYSPPVATRVFAYPNLAAYEVYLHKSNSSIINQLAPNTIQNIKSDTTEIDYSYAALEAYYTIAKKLVFSEHLADSMIMKVRQQVDSITSNTSRIEASRQYGESIAKQMIPWIDADGYAKVKADDAYTIRGHDSTWVLTPPNYEAALEPNWKKLRPIVLDDVKNFQPAPRPPFSTNKNSVFYKEALKVYNQSKDNADEQRNIAKHWDCNPNEFKQFGHGIVFTHRISPPGHWVGITKSLCQIKGADFDLCAKAYAGVTTAMFDGIIACWHTKYTEELIRPVTYINRYIDETWSPYIQTPPFPEFTSGHSVVSGCSSSILETLFPNTAFVDYTEVEFGLPARSFESVHQAGEEASLSRYYGGIHYQFGIDNGLEQGRKIGNHIINILQRQ